MLEDHATQNYTIAASSEGSAPPITPPTPQVRTAHPPCKCLRGSFGDCNADKRAYELQSLKFEFADDFHVTEYDIIEAGYPITINANIPISRILDEAMCVELSAMMAWVDGRHDKTLPLSDSDACALVAVRLLNKDLAKVYLHGVNHV